MNERSCIGCKYLYGHGSGYSNYTWMNTDIKCAKDANPALPAEKPSDWLDDDYDWYKTMQVKMDTLPDNWAATMNMRCPLFSKGVYIEFDPDGEVYAPDVSQDWEQIEIVSTHADRPISEAAARMAAFLFIPGRD